MRTPIAAKPWADELRYLLLGCAVPACLFGLLGWYNLSVLRDLVSGPGRPDSLGGWMTGPIERALYLAFVSIPVVLYISRPRARRRAGGWAPRTAAFVGTTMLLVFPAYFDDGPRLATPPRIVHAFAASAAVVFTAFGVYGLLYLRHNFSIIPEARGLVNGGPYRIVRHPLYLAEIGVSVSLALLGDVHSWSVLILLPFIAVQTVRTVYEEQLLRSEFPQYCEYALHTGRIVPFLRPQRWIPHLT